MNSAVSFSAPVAPGPVICVLGMHRSGTSCLAGSLQMAGLCLGNHSTWNPHNQRGNRENPEIMDLHHDMLADNGYTWDNPPRELHWDESHLQRARAIIATYPEDRRWGFKDPKTLLALSGWRSLLGEMQYIGIFRHPLLVARSLETRNSMPLEQALSAWKAYNSLLLEEHRAHAFPLLDFDWGEQKFHDKLNEVLPALGLTPISEEQRFYTRDLHHHDSLPADGDSGLPGDILELYHELQQRTV